MESVRRTLTLSLWQIRARPKSQDAKPRAIQSLPSVDAPRVQSAVRFRPRGRMHCPLNGVAAKNKARPRKMARRTDDFRRVPAVRVHNAHCVKRVLNGVFRLLVFQNGRFGNPVPLGDMRHNIRFEIPIVRRAAGHDDMRGFTRFIFAYALQRSLLLLRPRRAVRVRRGTQHDQSIEMPVRCISLWDCPINQADEANYQQRRQRGNQQPALQPAHRMASGIRGTRMSSS